MSKAARSLSSWGIHSPLDVKFPVALILIEGTGELSCETDFKSEVANKRQSEQVIEILSVKLGLAWLVMFSQQTNFSQKPDLWTLWKHHAI